MLQTGLFGHIWTADILISKKVPLDTVYVLADPEFVGVNFGTAPLYGNI